MAVAAIAWTPRSRHVHPVETLAVPGQIQGPPPDVADPWATWKKASRGAWFPLSRYLNSSRCHRPTRRSANSAARRHVCRRSPRATRPTERIGRDLLEDPAVEAVAVLAELHDPIPLAPADQRVKAPFGGHPVTFQASAAGS